MRRALTAVLAALLACSLVSCATAVTMQINASPSQAHVGDVITITGSIEGVKTIVVYLFVTGSDLTPRGVTLENLNIPTGHGLFTTAPVNMDDDTWKYIWDTSVILGNLKPGKYTVYAVSSPVDQIRYVKGEYATAEIEFLPSQSPSNEVPIPPVFPVAALVIVAAALLAKRHNLSAGMGR